MELTTSEYLEEADEELKRLDHIIFVSLKYTRTVDVIRNALHRLISTFDVIIEALLEQALEHKKIEAIPKSPSLRTNLVLEVYPEDKDLLTFMTFYVFLRELIKAEYGRREEYRRHVTMVTPLYGKKTAEIDIDNLETCQKVARQFFDHARLLMEGKKEDD